MWGKNVRLDGWKRAHNTVPGNRHDVDWNGSISVFSPQNCSQGFTPLNDTNPMGVRCMISNRQTVAKMKTSVAFFTELYFRLYVLLPTRPSFVNPRGGWRVDKVAKTDSCFFEGSHTECHAARWNTQILIKLCINQTDYLFHGFLWTGHWPGSIAN